MPENTGGLVYGTIVVATLLAAEGPGRETYGTTIGSVALALLVYWLAEAYAKFAGERARRAEPFELSGLMSVIGHEIAVIYGALGPLAALLIAWALGASLGTALDAGVWTAAAMIAATELVLGVRSQQTGRELVLQTGFGVVLGLLVVALKVLLH